MLYRGCWVWIRTETWRLSKRNRTDNEEVVILSNTRHLKSENHLIFTLFVIFKKEFLAVLLLIWKWDCGNELSEIPDSTDFPVVLFHFKERTNNLTDYITFKSKPILYSKFDFWRTRIDLVHSEHVVHADWVQSFWGSAFPICFRTSLLILN
jgi:hypothetical protein